MDGRRGSRDRTGSSYVGFASNHSKALNDRDNHRSYDDRPGSPRGGGRGFGSGRGRGRGRYDGRGRGSMRDVSTGSLATNPVHAERFEPSPTSAMARRPVDRPSSSPDPSGYESGEIMPQRPLVHPRRSNSSNVEPHSHSEPSKGGGGRGGLAGGRGSRFETRGRDGSSGRFFPSASRQHSGGRGGDSFSSGRPGEARFQEPPRAIEISRSNDPSVMAIDGGGPREHPGAMVTSNPRSMHQDSIRGGLDRVHDTKRPREDPGYPLDHDEKRFRPKDYGQKGGLGEGNSIGGPHLDSKSRPSENFQRFDHDRGHPEPRTTHDSLRRDDRRGRLDQCGGSDRFQFASNSDRLEPHLVSGPSRYNDAANIGPDTETARYKDSERIGMDSRPGRYGEVDPFRADSRPTRIIDSDRRGVGGGPGRLVDSNRLQQDSGPSRYVLSERKGSDNEPGRFNHSGMSPARYHDVDRMPSDNGPGRYRDAERLHTESGPNRFYDSDRRGVDRGPGRHGDLERFSHDGGPGRYIDSDPRVSESGSGRPVGVERFPPDALPGRYIDSDRRAPDSGAGRHFTGDRFPPDGGSGRYIDSDRRVLDSELPVGRQVEIDRFPPDNGPIRYTDSDRRGPDLGPGRYDVADRRGSDSGPPRHFDSDHRGPNGGTGRYGESDLKRSDIVSVRYRDSEPFHPESGPERFINPERSRGPDSGPPRRFDVDRSHPESGPVRHMDSDLSGLGGFKDSVGMAPASGPGRYSGTDRRGVDTGPGRYPDSHRFTVNQDREQGRNKDFDRAGLDRELTVSRNKNVERTTSDGGFHRFNTNNSVRTSSDNGPGPYNDNTQVTPDLRFGRFDAPDRTELETRPSRYNDSDRVAPVLVGSRNDDSRKHAGTLLEPPGSSMRNLPRMPSSNSDDQRGGPPLSTTRRDHEIMGKMSYRDDKKDGGFKDEGSHHPNSRLEAPESRFRGSRPSEDIPPQRPRPSPPMDRRGRDTAIDLSHRDTPLHDMRGVAENKRDMDARSNSPNHDRHSRPPPSADVDQSRDFRGGPKAPIEATGKPNWAGPTFNQGHITTSGPPRRNMGRQSMDVGPRYRDETRPPDVPFSDSSRPFDGHSFYSDRGRGRGRGRGGRGQFSRGGGMLGQGRRRFEDEQSGQVGQSSTAFNDRESSNDPSSFQSNDGDKKPESAAVPSSGDSQGQDVVKEVQESTTMPEPSQPQEEGAPALNDIEAKPDVDGAVKPEPIEIETESKEEAEIDPRPISPPPPGQPSGVVLALARLADLEAQMEYAYAKHMLLVQRQKELKFQTKVLEDLPVGIDAFREELDKLISEASLEAVQ